ncbi:MAG: translation initiation factor eIF-1A [Candidatus Aenigmarchaeota archaeon]|nr:translation initiation factor eIF-1A [Candidatus Aenigmarchaeota archaeon]
MEQQQEEVVRVRMPRRGEVLGEILELYGASRFKVSCQDGKVRMCRIPGKFRKRIKISMGDLVIVIPWDVEPDAKGDIDWIYTRTQAAWIRKKGIFK